MAWPLQAREVQRLRLTAFKAEEREEPGEAAHELGPLLEGSGLVEGLRRVKSPRELAEVRRAAAANDAGMGAGLAAVRAGASENAVAAAIMQASIAAGGEYVGMQPFVTSGSRSGIPHTTLRRRRIQAGDVVILDTAACHNRYHAALYRTVAVGVRLSAPRLLRYGVDPEPRWAGTISSFGSGTSCGSWSARGVPPCRSSPAACRTIPASTSGRSGAISKRSKRPGVRS